MSPAQVQHWFSVTKFAQFAKFFSGMNGQEFLDLSPKEINGQGIGNEDVAEALFEEMKTAARCETKDPVRWKFLQRYYHKGAFFQEKTDTGRAKEALYDRDIGHAVMADKMHGDKEDLPEIMQKRHYGERHQSKWTHLQQEDTTAPLWQSGGGNLASGPSAKAGAMSGSMAENLRTGGEMAVNFASSHHKGPLLGSASYGARKNKIQSFARP
eukprot:368436_1